jgi:phosphatidylserine synthase
MHPKPTDAWTLLALLAAFGAMLLAFQGDPDLGALLFLVAFAADVAHAAVAPAREAHPFGSELDDVVELVAFGAAPGLFLYVAYEPVHPALAAALGSVPLVTAAIRLALHSVRPRGDAALALGLPRAWSALFSVALCRSSAFDVGAVRHAAIGVLPLVASLNLGRFPFVRPLAWPLSRVRALLCTAAAASVGAAAALGNPFDAVLAWSVVALAAGVLWAPRPTPVPERNA